MKQNWEEKFLGLHFEPEHIEGETCWCKPVSKVVEGVYHIEHQEQRMLLIQFIKDLLKNEKD